MSCQNPWTSKASTSQGQEEACSAWQHHGNQARGQVQEPVLRASPYSSSMQARNSRQVLKDQEKGGRFVFPLQRVHANEGGRANCMSPRMPAFAVRREEGTGVQLFELWPSECIADAKSHRP